jgi:hypothetical protein
MTYLDPSNPFSLGGPPLSLAAMVTILCLVKRVRCKVFGLIVWQRGRKNGGWKVVEIEGRRRPCDGRLRGFNILCAPRKYELREGGPAFAFNSKSEFSFSRRSRDGDVKGEAASLSFVYSPPGLI